MQAVIEIYESVRRPDSLLEFFAGDNFARLFEQRLQNPERLLLQPNANSAFAQLSGTQIQLKAIETHELRNWEWHKDNFWWNSYRPLKRQQFNTFFLAA
ncbi:MAG TPA: hypothetical protein VGJ30_20250 [Candidatus Angelobacter sp.]|jgi:hypothetical protein